MPCINKVYPPVKEKKKKSKLFKNNNKKSKAVFTIIMAGVLVVCFLLPLLLGEVQNLGYFKINECVNLIQTCDNCSYVNVTSLINPNSFIVITDKSMEDHETYYNYTFCSTSLLGKYIYNTLGDVNGIPTVQPVDFYITGNGKENPDGIVIVLFSIIFLVFMAFLIFMFLYSFGHLIKLDFDLIDLSYNLGIYFVLFTLYFLSQFYLGNPTFENILLVILQVGAFTHVMIPFVAFTISVTFGSMKRRKFNAGQPPKTFIGRRFYG